MADGCAFLAVRAKHNFTGRNNDELCFKKGDVIVVTQQLSEGWWEGTLNGRTGWFPSNYVTVDKQDGLTKSRMQVAGSDADAGVSVVTNENRLAFRNMVLRDLLENEQKNLEELVELWEGYLNPLKEAEVVSRQEFASLVGNIGQLIQFQSDFYDDLVEEAQKAPKDRRIGGKFLRSAQTLKHLLAAYCRNHPTAVSVMERNRENLTHFMQSKGANELLLVSRLSQPFRHVDTYSVALLEIERNMEDNHPDRGDTQRAVEVYREISQYCCDLRKQKEMQLDLLKSTISNWEGEPLQSLGEILLLTKTYAKLGDNYEGDSCIVLLPECIVVLQVSPSLNGYIYKSRVSLNGNVVGRRVVDNEENRLSVELVSKSDDGKPCLTFTVANMDELNRWLEKLESVVSEGPDTLISPTTPSRYTKVENEVSPLLKPKVSRMPVPGHAELLKKADEASARASLPAKPYSGYCLRPLATQKRLVSGGGASALESDIKLRKKGNQVAMHYDADEIELLQVVELYCSSTSDSSWKPLICARNGKVPDILIAEDEKIFCEEFVGDQLVVQEKTLVDTVYALKDQVRILSEIVNDLSKSMHAEKAVHKRPDEVNQIVPERTSTSSSQSNCNKDCSSADGAA